jgi:Flp pilus assembly protein TadD
MASEFNPEPNYQVLSQRYMSAGQWDRSLATAREWLSKEPENVWAHRVAAQSLVNLDRHSEAFEHLEKVLARNPRDDFAHRLMAMVYFNAGKFRLADQSIQKAIALDPNDASNWHQLAHMTYRHGDLATARKHVARARELDPRNAEICNLEILCNPGGPENARQKIRQFEEALALDPENSNLHNNMGIQYLNHLKDYARAEECFRHALFLDPTSKNTRKNLFITVKKRDRIYRILCAPKDALYQVIGFFGRVRRYNLFLYILIIPIWILAFRFIFVGLLLWFCLVWPLTRVYEYLTIGDLRARAGELGAQRGGILGLRKWPIGVRLGIFTLFLFSFWGFVALLFTDKSPLSGPIPPQSLGLLAFFGLFTFLVCFLVFKIKAGIRAWTARRRAREMENVISPKRQG